MISLDDLGCGITLVLFYCEPIDEVKALCLSTPEVCQERLCGGMVSIATDNTKGLLIL